MTKMCAEAKNLKNDNESVKKEINSTNIALKPARKEALPHKQLI